VIINNSNANAVAARKNRKIYVENKIIVGRTNDDVMQLEKSGEESDDFAELTAEFPKIKSISDLPDSVVQKSELRGTKLLDEYLRYRLTEEREAASAALKQKNAENLSLGSLTDRKGGINPETAEFLKGLWR